ncbi:MAG: PKD domain-containing protein [Crocinitomicaceae bacterium]|nr:PKD domain-containing protein [Crocinitomicaceae bacterium]
MKNINISVFLALIFLVFTSCKKTPNANFTLDDNYDSHYIEKGEEIIMTPDYMDAKSYHWDFGDGNISEEQVAKHSWSEPGDYTVTLTAKNGNKESSYERQVRVTGYAYKFDGVYTGITINNSTGCGQTTESMSLVISASLTSDSLNIINLSNRVPYSLYAEVTQANSFTLSPLNGVTFNDNSQWDMDACTVTWVEEYNDLTVSATFSDANFLNSCGTMTSVMTLARAN